MGPKPIMYNFCKRCEKKLVTSESKLKGYGPTCYKKSIDEGQQMVIDDYGVYEQDGGEQSNS